MLKLRQMGTHEEHMKGVLPWLVRWARQRACARDFCPALAALFHPEQKGFSSSHFFSSFV
jgi:hypothetical protein